MSEVAAHAHSPSREITIAQMRAALQATSPTMRIIYEERTSYDTSEGTHSPRSSSETPAPKTRPTSRCPTPPITHYTVIHSRQPDATAVVRRAKSGGLALLCGLQGTSSALENFDDVYAAAKRSKMGNAAVQIAVEIVQEEYANARKPSVKRKSRFSGLIGRKRSGSETSKVGVAV